MSNIYDNQIKEMQRLINYGRKENTTSNSQSIVEYCAKGADGKTYGIIREGHNFYIKVAPKKNTEILAEDYDYIGGFNNRKENEYSTYTLASKQFDLKLKALNEAYNAKTYSSQYKPTESSEWQINETKEMRRELDRYKQLVENVNNILEGREIVGLNEDSDPYTQKPTMYSDKIAGNNIKKDSKPVTVTNKDMQSDKSPKSNGDGGDAYQEKPKYPDVKKGSKKSVADQNPSGGKVVKGNGLKENRTIKINEEQVLAWSKSKDFMDKTHGTHIGSSSPFSDEVDGCSNGTYCEADTEPIREEVAVHITDDQNNPKPGVSKPRHCGDPFEETVNESEINPNEVAGFNDDDDEYDDEYEGLTIKDDSDPDRIGFEDDEEISEPEDIDDDLGLTPEEMEKWNITYSPDDEEETGMDDPGNFDPESDFAGKDDMDDEDDDPIDPDEDLLDDEMVDDNDELGTNEFIRVLSPGMNKNQEKKALAGHFGVKPSKLEDFEEKGNRFWRRKHEAMPDNVEPTGMSEPEPLEEPEIDRDIDFDEDAYWGESKRRRGERIYEVRLDDFGKHPAYRKEVMTLPPNKEIDRYGRDWNDDSAKGDEPFGKQIGSSAPYTEKVVDMLTDAIFNRIKKKV